MKGNKISTIALRGGLLILIAYIVILYFIIAYAKRFDSDATNMAVKVINSVLDSETADVESEFTELSLAISGVDRLLDFKDNPSILLSAITGSTCAYKAFVVDKNGMAVGSDGREYDFSEGDYSQFVDVGVKTVKFFESDITGESSIVVAEPCREGTVIALCKLSDVLDEFKRDPAFKDSFFALFNFNNGDMELIWTEYEGEGSSKFLEGDIVDNIKSGGGEVSGWNKISSRIREDKQSFLKSVYEGETRWIGSAAIDIYGEKFALLIGVKDGYVKSLFSKESKHMYDFRLQMIVSLIVLFVIYLVIVIMILAHNSEKSRELEDKADTDLLTGLNNKISTESKISDYIAANPKSQGVLLLIDVDNFKKINDTMGHSFGDDVLSELGTRLKSLYRVSDIVGRIGGDEFIVFLKDINDRDIIEREARKLETFFKGFEVGQYVKYSVTASLGAAIYSEDGSTFEELYRNADAALYTAKHNGKKQLYFYKQKEKQEAAAAEK